MKKWLVPGIILGAVLCVVAPAGQVEAAISDSLPAAEMVIQRYVDALGGREAIQRLSTRVCMGRRTTDLDWTPPVCETVPIVTYSRVPGSLLIVEHTPHGIMCEGFDGTTWWAQHPGGVSREGQPADPKLSWLINPHNALRLEDYFPGLRVTGQDYIDGGSVLVLEPIGLDRVYYSLYFDDATGLLVRVGYYTVLQDYREVDGVKFPFRVSTSRQGGSTTYVFDLVAHNLPLDSSLFAVPTPAAMPGR
ncbi:MAG: hypothetical protein WAW06_08155 [bacterium]